MKFTLGTGLCH